MRARLIVIGRIGGKNSPQVRLAEDDYMVQALAMPTFWISSAKKL